MADSLYYCTNVKSYYIPFHTLSYWNLHWKSFHICNLLFASLRVGNLSSAKFFPTLGVWVYALDSLYITENEVKRLKEMPTFTSEWSMSSSALSPTILLTIEEDTTKHILTILLITLNSLHPCQMQLHFTLDKHIFISSSINLNSFHPRQAHLHFPLRIQLH